MTEPEKSPEYGVVEAGATAVGADGETISEDVTAIVDADGNPVAVDDLITVEEPDGSSAFDETISLVDDEGNLVPVHESVGVMDADGNIAVAESDLTAAEDDKPESAGSAD
jgi:hypothetical protein